MTLTVERAYRVLGLTPGAPKEAVHRAYRDLAQVWHPDRFAHNARLQEKAQENLRRINEAYEVLRDYEPPEQPSGMYARLTETFSAVLGLGDILKTSEIRKAQDRVEREAERRARRSGRGSRSARDSRSARGRSRRSGHGGAHSGRGSGRSRRGPQGTHRHEHRTAPRGRHDHPSGTPSAEPPPVVGFDDEERLLEERTGQPIAIWLVLILSVLLVVAAVLLL